MVSRGRVSGGSLGLVDPVRPVRHTSCHDADMSERFEIQRTIPADAADIFRIVSDPRGHVAIDASGMLQSSTGEPAGAVGDTFMIHMDRESLGDLPMGKYDVTVTITGYEQDRFITWEVSGEGFPSIGHYYGYRLEPVTGGTVVTSIYDWSNVGENWKATGAWPIIPESALKATLGILERTVRADTVGRLTIVCNVAPPIAGDGAGIDALNRAPFAGVPRPARDPRIASRVAVIDVGLRPGLSGTHWVSEYRRTDTATHARSCRLGVVRRVNSSGVTWRRLQES